MALKEEWYDLIQNTIINDLNEKSQGNMSVGIVGKSPSDELCQIWINKGKIEGTDRLIITVPRYGWYMKTEYRMKLIVTVNNDNLEIIVSDGLGYNMYRYLSDYNLDKHTLMENVSLLESVTDLIIQGISTAECNFQILHELPEWSNLITLSDYLRSKPYVENNEKQTTRLKNVLGGFLEIVIKYLPECRELLLIDYTPDDTKYTLNNNFATEPKLPPLEVTIYKPYKENNTFQSVITVVNHSNPDDGDNNQVLLRFTIGDKSTVKLYLATPSEEDYLVAECNLDLMTTEIYNGVYSKIEPYLVKLVSPSF